MPGSGGGGEDDGHGELVDEPAVDEEALRAAPLHREPHPLVEAARHETNPRLVRTAVHTLGAMGATSQLLSLYHDTSSAETKADIINGMMPAGQNRYDTSVSTDMGEVPQEGRLVAAQKPASLSAESPKCGLLNQSHTRSISC